jgi:hypothetical protein
LYVDVKNENEYPLTGIKFPAIDTFGQYETLEKLFLKFGLFEILFENRSGNDFDQIVEKFFFSSLLSVE